VLLANPSVRHCLIEEEAPHQAPAVPLTAARINETGPSGLPNWSIRFSYFEQELSAPCSIRVPTYIGDSAGELTTSSKKKGGPNTNGSHLNKDNIIKPTLDNLTEEDRKALEAYHKEVDELFFSCYEVMRQELTQKNAASIIILKAKVTPKVRSNPSLSLDNVQSMINSTLERQAKRSDELMCRLIVEWDGKKLVDSNVHHSSSSCTINFAQTNP
jgi:hypothetical protein